VAERRSLFAPAGPGMMRGVTLGGWLRLLWANGFRVPPRYWPKAARTTLHALGNTPLRWLEALAHGRRVAAAHVEPPLFILGHWRSGTTHLQNLLAADTRFATPTFFQASRPHHFLIAERLVPRRRPATPATRGVDNVPWHSDSPAESEVALCRAAFLSPVMAQVFPRRAAFYDRYLTFRDVPDAEVRRWQAALVRLAKKLTLRHGRPLLLKAPPNTARVRLLLETFPDARFVHIRRHPHAVYQSTVRLRRTLSEVFAFQDPDPALVHARVVRQYREMYDAYFEQSGLVPAGRLCELAFEDLEKDPLGQLERVYTELSLPDFEQARPALEAYVRSLEGYKKNEHPPLPEDVRAELAREWLRCFDEWGYPA
jgi:LPS sulfotransferase NodH